MESSSTYGSKNGAFGEIGGIFGKTGDENFFHKTFVSCRGSKKFLFEQKTFKIEPTNLNKADGFYVREARV